MKYNILLGNPPGSVDYFVSTGGSGGAAGVYKNEDGSYSTAVTVDGTDYLSG